MMKKYIPTLLIMGGVFLGGNVKAEITLFCHVLEQRLFEVWNSQCHTKCGDYAKEKGWRQWKSSFEKMDPNDKLSQRCEITQKDIEYAKKNSLHFRACVCKDTTKPSEKNTPEIPLNTIPKKQN